MKATIQQTLVQAQQRLQAEAGLHERDARMEARLLLSHVLQVNHAWLIAHAQQPMPVDALKNDCGTVFVALLQRRGAGEPMAYILGHREFYGLDLQVTPATLIPRSDTETLVDAALEKIEPTGACGILDLGTGSGAIALAIAHHRPQAMVTALDASPAALQIAQANAQRLQIRNVQFLLSDWFAAWQLPEMQPGSVPAFDFILGNPPYIAAGDIHLNSGDLRFEPLSALAAGADGLDDMRKIIQSAPLYLKPKAWLMLEHGYDQASEIAQLMEKRGFTAVSHVEDLAGISRVSVGQFG